MKYELLFLTFILVILSINMVGASSTNDSIISDDSSLSGSDNLIISDDIAGYGNDDTDGSDYLSLGSDSDYLSTDSADYLSSVSDDFNMTVYDNSTTVKSGKEILINNETYSTYFNSEGTLISGLVSSDDVLVLGNLSNKNMLFNQTVHIDGKGTAVITDGQIIITSEASGSSVNGVTFIKTYAEEHYFGGIVLETDYSSYGVSNVLLSNNKVYVLCTNNTPYSGNIIGILIWSNPEKICSNISLINNTININSEETLTCGIGVYYYSSDSVLARDIYLINNTINITSPYTVEAFNIDDTENLVMANNTVIINPPGFTDVSRTCGFYGLAARHIYGANLTNNSYYLFSNNSYKHCMGEFIFYSSDFVISDSYYNISSPTSKGIYTWSVQNLSCHDNNIYIYDTGIGYGIESSYTNNSNISYNNIYLEGKKELDDTANPNQYGIHIYGTGENITVFWNTVNSTYDAGTDYGVYVDYFGLVNVTCSVMYNYLYAANNQKLGDDAVYYNTSYNFTVKYNMPNSKYTKNGKILTFFTFSNITQNFNSTDTTISKTFSCTLKNIFNLPLANKAVTLSFDGKTYSLTTNSNGVASTTLPINYSEDTRYITLSFSGDSQYCSASNTSMVVTTFSIEKLNSTLLFSNMTTYVVINNQRNGEYFNVKLVDDNQNPIPDKTIFIGFNGKIYKRTTDSAGQIQLQINIGYTSANTFAITFLGDDEYSGTMECAIIVVKQRTSTMTSSKYTYSSSSSSKKLSVTVKYNGSGIASKEVTFVVNGAYYITTTNSKGVATVKISLSSKGTYSYTATFKGDNQYTKSTSTNKVVIS